MKALYVMCLVPNINFFSNHAASTDKFLLNDLKVLVFNSIPYIVYVAHKVRSLGCVLAPVGSKIRTCF